MRAELALGRQPPATGDSPAPPQPAEPTAIREEAAAAASIDQRTLSLEKMVTQLTALVEEMRERLTTAPPLQHGVNPQPMTTEPSPQRAQASQDPPPPPPMQQQQDLVAPPPWVAAVTKQLGRLEKKVEKGNATAKKQAGRSPPVTKSGGPPGSRAAGAAAGKKTKGANDQAPAAQMKPPSPDLAASPHLGYSFVLSGFSSLQGVEDPQELRDVALAAFRTHLGIDVSIANAFYLGRRAPTRSSQPQRVFVQLGSPSEGDLVRHNRCKLKSSLNVVADALTKEELVYRRLLVASFEKLKAQGSSVQFQRCRLFEKVTGEDGSVRKREITPGGGMASA